MTECCNDTPQTPLKVDQRKMETLGQFLTALNSAAILSTIRGIMIINCR